MRKYFFRNDSYLISCYRVDKNFAKSSHGFALLLAISFMAFLLVLLLSIVPLMSVSFSSASESVSVTRAKENARLASLIALGELQRQLGPDMRISARGEIFGESLSQDKPSAGVEPFDAAEPARFWTGVWRSDQWAPGDFEDRKDRFLEWLVSMSPADRERVESAKSLPFDPMDSTQAVALASYPGQGDGGEDLVLRAPLQTLNNGDGAYAWWVSDEGVKASIELFDPFANKRQGAAIEDIPRYLYPHRPNFSATNWFENVDWEDANLLVRQGRIGPIFNMGLLFAESADFSEDVLASLNHSLQSDFTEFSLGVLSDNRRGGLKRDLSLAFWRDPNERHSLGTGASFTPNAGFEADFRNHRIFNKEDYPVGEQGIRGSGDLSFFGPRWEILRDYHNSFQKLLNPNVLDTSLRLWDPLLGQALYDLPRSRSVESWESSDHRGTIKLPSVIGGRFSTERDPIQIGGQFAEPGQQILGVDTPLSFGSQPVEMTTNGLYPLLQRASLFFTLDMREVEDPDDSSKKLYAPRINAYIVVHFWNPHNVTITSVDAVNGVDAGGWMVDIFSEVEFTIERQSESGDVLENVTFDYNQLRMSEVRQSNPELQPGFEVFRTMFNANSGSGLFEFRPGEIRAFVLSDVTSDDIGNPQLAGNLEPYFTVPRVFLRYDQTGGPLIEWGANKITNEPFLFESNDRIAVELRLKDQTDLSSTGFNLNVIPRFKHNSSYTQGFRWIWIDPDDTVGFADILSIDQFISDPDLMVELGGLEIKMNAADTVNGDVRPRILANFNPRALYNHTQMGEYADFQLPNYQLRFLEGDPLNEIAWNFETLDGRTLLRGYWGASDSSSGSNFVSLFDVPRRAPESLGQYQHAHLAIYPHQPAYPLGNSLADPHVGRNLAVDRQNGKTQMDLSWFLNDTLWDGYFLSTIDPDRPVDGRLAPLRNRFLEIDSGVDYDVTDPQAYREVASNLLLRGAFNVNSTSEEAWAAVLAGLGGEGLQYFDSVANDAVITASTDFPYFRHSLPNGPNNSAWLGGLRDLSREEIRKLAREMVEQVRKRGPFLSLSDFVNRRLVSDERGLKGALQAAIDESNLQTVDIGGENASLPGAPFSEHASGGQSDLAPGYLSQADVLNSLAPFLSVRSDTFVIRGYGSVMSGSDNTMDTEAWMELLVQRIPEPLISDSFGRPFKILGMRWLSRNEI